MRIRSKKLNRKNWKTSFGQESTFKVVGKEAVFGKEIYTIKKKIQAGAGGVA
jgi:hypothetical protein